MSTTTIKVDGAVRDRLAAVARARGTTMGALLAEAAEQLEREQHWLDVEAAHSRLQREDPDGWRDYLGELAEWGAAVADPDRAAAQEWPEHNG